MCDDHALGRRQFLGAAVLGAAGAALPRGLRTGDRMRRVVRPPARPVAGNGTSAYSMAMHIHSSFSEQQGSMDAQLYQAAQSLVDVLWWTDHDQPMTGLGYRDTVHFTSLDAEQPDPGQGKAWHWTPAHSGQLASYSGGIVASPCSPNDPVAGGALTVSAQSSRGTAGYGYYADSGPSDLNYRDNLTGQSQSIDVLLGPGWSNGYAELAITTSAHPSGQYALSYRLVPGNGPVTQYASGSLGVTVIPVDGPGSFTVTLTPASDGSGWVTLTVNPSQDIAALWNSVVDHRDFALWKMNLNAVSTGDPVSVYWDYLNFDRSQSGDVAFSQQQDMMAALAATYPSVTQVQGLEITEMSMLPHLNWFGGAQILDFGQMAEADWLSYLAQTVIPAVHQAGGLASYNHPFGSRLDSVAKGTPLPPAQQDALLAKMAMALLPANGVPAALGTDLLEVGYPVRAGVDLAHHLALWYVMSRNALFLTGNGASDNHTASPWPQDVNNWATSVWAGSTGTADLLAALAAGRAWCGSLSEFATSSGASLDLTVDGTCPMGSVSLSSLPSRQLTMTATGIPPGGSVTLWQGDVDYAGTSGLQSNAGAVGTYPRHRINAARGSLTVPVDTTAGSYARLTVADAHGTTVAASNPVLMLQNTPPGGIPAPRQA